MKRNSSIEVLRIFAIIVITLSHLAINTSILKDGGMNEVIGDFCIIGGRVGVNIFALITGWFLCEKQRDAKSILKLWLQTFFYSILLYFVCIFLLKDSLNMMEMVSYFLPICFQKWWYTSAVIGLYLISPILNILIVHMNKKDYRRLIIIATLMQVIIPMFTNQEVFYSNLLWFIYLYFIAAYIKKHCQDKMSMLKEKHIYIIIFAVSVWLVIFTSILTMGWLGKSIGIFKQAQYFFASNTSILSLIDGILWLLVGVTSKEYTSQIINYVAAHTFSMYLIQSHPFFNKHIYEYFNSITTSTCYWLYGTAYIMFLLVCAWILDSLEKPIAGVVIKYVSKFRISKEIEDILKFKESN